MGWFALAALLGLLVGWGWQQFAPDNAFRQYVWAATGFVLLMALFVIWAVYVERNSSPRGVFDALASGQVARFLIGGLLGFIAARVLLNPQPLTLQHLFTALALFLIGMSAPHFDGWLGRLTGFKSTVVEFQLAGTATANHKVAVAEKLEAYAADVVFQTLENYSEKIQNDIDYVQHIGIPSYPRGRRIAHAAPQVFDAARFLDSARKIKPVFEKLIGPLAKCLREQIETGMNIDRTRAALRPVAYMLQQIVLNQADPLLSGEPNHVDFWKSLLAVPKEIDKLRVRTDPVCARYSAEYDASHKDKTDQVAYPRISKSQDLGYLYVSAALLLFFVGETNTALSLLEDSKTKIAFVDHRFLGTLGLLRSFRGQPAARVVEPYEEMRQVAMQRQQMVTAYCERTTCDAAMKSVIARERTAELVAMNNVATAVAEDLARGFNSAKDLEVTAETYANKLKEMVEKEADPGAVDAYTDTYAYTLLVIEAQRPLPNIDTIKKLARTLQGLVERCEKRVLAKLDKGKQPNKDEEFALNTARVHYNSARELAGQ